MITMRLIIYLTPVAAGIVSAAYAIFAARGREAPTRPTSFRRSSQKSPTVAIPAQARRSIGMGRSGLPAKESPFVDRRTPDLTGILLAVRRYTGLRAEGVCPRTCTLSLPLTGDDISYL